MGLLSTKLRGAIGTDQWKSIPIESTLIPRTPEIAPVEEKLQDIHKIPGVVNDLEEVRNRYALRVTKGMSQQILSHKNCAAILSWLEIKPLFVSSTIFADHGKYPFLKIAAFLNVSEKTVRRHFSVWRKMKLVKLRDKDLILSSYRQLNKIFKIDCKRKYKLLNNGETKSVIQTLAINENLVRQTFKRNNKLLQLETGKLFDHVDTSNTNKSGCGLSRPGRRLRKALMKRIDEYLPKWINIYNIQTNQLVNPQKNKLDFPRFNPNVTLSCGGVSTVCGLSSKSSGYRISKRLQHLGLITRKIETLKIDKCAAVYEAEHMGVRSDVFGYKYPSKRSVSGYEKKYFRMLPQQIETRLFILEFPAFGQK